MRRITVAPDPRLENGFIVKGAKPELWIKQTVFDNDEAVGYLAIASPDWVWRSTLRAGAEPGCTVTIGDALFRLGSGYTSGRGRYSHCAGNRPRLETNTRVSAKDAATAKRIRHGLADEDSDMYDESTW